MPSRKYRLQSDSLWKQYNAGEIDSNTFKTRLEQAKSQEMQSHREGVFFDIAWSENDILSYEETRQKLREQKESEELADNLPPRLRYKTKDVPETIQSYRSEAKYYRRIHNFFQAIIIVGSILVTGIIGFGEVPKLVPVAISTLVGVSAGFIGYYKFRERSFNLQQTADSMEQESKALKLGIGPYKKAQPEDALELFAERVEFLIDEQKKRQQQLEQPPDAKLTKSG